MKFNEGDKVRVDIPDKSDPDYKYHRMNGVVVYVLEDNAEENRAEPDDNYIYRVDLRNGDRVDFRWRDLRPVEN